MLDDGRYGTVTELAVVEKLDRRYLRTILMPTLLVLDIGEAILVGQQHTELGGARAARAVSAGLGGPVDEIESRLRDTPTDH
jgi:hypothetical protein